MGLCYCGHPERVHVYADEPNRTYTACRDCPCKRYRPRPPTVFCPNCRVQLTRLEYRDHRCGEAGDDEL